jgi:hypothetical protein
MKRLFAGLLLSISAHAAGSVTQTVSTLPTGIVVVAMNWTGDTSTGSVPPTIAQLNNCCAGYLVTQAEIVPGIPQPSANYSVALLDSANVDLLGGAAINLSPSSSSAFASASYAPPLQGTFTLSISGQFAAAAQGIVYVFMAKAGAVNIAQGTTSTAVSANWLTLYNAPFADSRAYNFSPQSPGSSLGVGADTITLNPMPAGINAYSIGQYVYISGGVGSAEAVPITAVGTNTVTVTCANTHTGVWTISSATSGAAEALAANRGGTLYFAPGGYPFYAPLLITAPATIVCSNAASTNLQAQSAVQDLIDITYTGADNSTTTISGCAFTSSVTKTYGTAIAISYPSAAAATPVQIHDNWFEGQFNSIVAVNACYLDIHNNSFHGGQGGSYLALSSPFNTDCGDNSIVSNWFFGGISGSTCITDESGGGLRIIDNKLLGCQTAINATWASGSKSNQFVVEGNLFDGPVVNGLIVSAADSTVVFTDMVINGNYFGGAPTDSFIKVNANGATLGRGTISGNNFIQNLGTGTVLNLISGSQFNVTGNSITGAPNPSASVLTVGSSFSLSLIADNLFYSFANGGYSISQSSSSLVINNFGSLSGPSGVIASATTAFPPYGIISLQPSGTVTAFVPTTSAAEQKWTVIPQGTTTWTAGSTIGNSCTMTALDPYTFVWNGSQVFIEGNGC